MIGSDEPCRAEPQAITQTQAVEAKAAMEAAKVGVGTDHSEPPNENEELLTDPQYVELQAVQERAKAANMRSKLDRKRIEVAALRKLPDSSEDSSDCVQPSTAGLVSNGKKRKPEEGRSEIIDLTDNQGHSRHSASDSKRLEQACGDLVGRLSQVDLCYRESQDDEHCGRHALNNILGSKVFTRDIMDQDKVKF